MTLVVAGLAFKVAAVPFHAWAPATYDGAPLPVAAYLSTASKLGGVIALLAVVRHALPPEVTGPMLALVAALTMTVGNLVALRQRRTVRLLAWSSVAQAGYILAPLGALALTAEADARTAAYAAALAYAVFFVLLELAAFAGVVALRRPVRTAAASTTCAARHGGIRGSVRGWRSRWSASPACHPVWPGSGRCSARVRPGSPWWVAVQRGHRPGLPTCGRRAALPPPPRVRPRSPDPPARWLPRSRWRPWWRWSSGSRHRSCSISPEAEVRPSLGHSGNSQS